MIAAANLLVRELNLLYGCRLLSRQGYYHQPDGNSIFCLLWTLLKWHPWKLSFYRIPSASEFACKHLWEMLQLAQPQQQSAACRQTSLRAWMGLCWHTEHVQSCGAVRVQLSSMCRMCCAHLALLVWCCAHCAQGAYLHHRFRDYLFADLPVVCRV